MSWWAGIGLSAGAILLLAPVTVPPTIPPTVPATTPSTIPATAPATGVPGSSGVPTTDDGDVLGCTASLFDPQGELDGPRVERAIERTAAALDADVHVRAEGTLDEGLDGRMVQLETACPSWMEGADRAPDLVIVMYSAVEREASVYYGADQGDALEDRWEPAVDAMTEQFRAGDLTGGVVDGLEVLRDPFPAPVTGDADPTDGDTIADGDGSSGGSGLPGVVWLGIVGVAALLIYNVARFMRTGEWGDEGSAGGDDDSSGWTSSSRRRSFGGFGSGSRRSSSSSSRRRSSSSSSKRRSGGGTKKW